MIDEAVYRDVDLLWEFLSQGSELVPQGDNLAILCGSRDIFIAEYAAGLFNDGRISTIICSGGHAHGDDLLDTGWSATEAEVFATELARLGVPEDRIHLETRATNTTENIAFSLDIAGRLDLCRGANIVLVHKPFMVLRTRLTARIVAPGRHLLVSSPRMSAAEYFKRCDDGARTLNIMVGDFERVFVYALKGFLAATDIPGEVIAAAEKLRSHGYSGHSLFR